MKCLLFVALMLPFSVSAGFYVCISETGVKGAQDFPCDSSDTTVTAVTDDDQREIAGERKAKSKRTDWDWLEPHVEDNSVDESKGKQWYYKTIKSDMTQRNVHIAILKSENQVNFDFPYSGMQKASLILKEAGSYGHDVLFSIEKGQILCGSNDCSVHVRFDEGNLITFPASEPSDYSSDAIFIKDEGKFAKGMLSSKMIRISVTIYQEGVNTFIFDVSDFNYSKFKPIEIKKIAIENKALFEIGEFGKWVTFKPNANNSKVFTISLPSNEGIAASSPVQLLMMRCKDKEIDAWITFKQHLNSISADEAVAIDDLGTRYEDWVLSDDSKALFPASAKRFIDRIYGRENLVVTVASFDGQLVNATYDLRGSEKAIGALRNKCFVNK